MSDFELNATEFALVCGVTVTTLGNWRATGMPEPRKPMLNAAYYDLRVHLAWVRDNVWTRGQDDRARKLKADADLAEMEADLQRGKLELVSDAEQRWSTILAGIRARLLSIPPKVGALLSAELTVAERSEIVRREIYEALDTLAGPPEALGATEEPEGEPERPTIRRKPGRPPRKQK